MPTIKDEITPKEFDAVKAKYDDALRKRRAVMLRQRKSGMTQQAIADYWSKDIALINRILKKKEGDNENSKRAD